MKISVVTTFNKSGYNRYGKRMIQTFLSNWPSAVELYVYSEDCVVDEAASNLHVLDLHSSSKEIVEFKKKWRDVPKANGDVTSDPVRSKRKDAGKGFKWDAVRFSHKVYSIFHCYQNINSDILVWMDADTVCHSPISMSELEMLFDQEYDLGYLGREKKYTECGLYSLNLNSPRTIRFLELFQRMYDDAEKGIFLLEEWHDSYVFDAVRKVSYLKENNWSAGLVVGEGHPLINSKWGAYLDHLKGDRKDQGRSNLKDLKVQRTEEYWQ